MRASGKTAAPARPAEWVERPERGSPRMLRLMAALSLHLGRRASRLPLHAIAWYFFAFAPAARRHARRYLRLALGRRPTARDRFRQLLCFATTIHDRVFLLNERDDLFEISIEGEDLMRAQIASGRGAFLMGSHLGSFEVAGAVGRREPGLRVAMAMYEGNATKLNAILKDINPRLALDVIPLGHIDAMLQISQRLDEGAFVGVLADRTLGQEPLQPVTLLGERAQLPTGPMRLAAILGCTVIFMAGLYRGANRYHVVFSKLADFSGIPAAARAAAVHEAIDRYAALLDRYCRSDPYNWFNFFDFWRPRAEERGP
jgi:predicted LPLAT superfamily acyltransferase